MRLYLVRHGQSIWQLSRSGDLDSDLSRLGITQSTHLSSWIESRPFLDRDRTFDAAVLCASPMRRAVETATLLQLPLSLPCEIVTALSEAPFHVASHLSSRESPFDGSATSPSPLYESFKEQSATALETLIRRASEAQGAVVAVTHGGLIKTLIRRAVDSDSFCLRLYNACFSLLEWRRGRWHVDFVNFCDHLPPAMRTT